MSKQHGKRKSALSQSTALNKRSSSASSVLPGRGKKPTTTTTASKPALSQLHLPFGNSAPTPTLAKCPDCGTSFSRSGQDASLHEQQHCARVTHGVPYTLSANDQVVRAHLSLKRIEGSIVLAPLSSKKAKEVLETMDNELSASALPQDVLDQCKLYLFISKRQVIGAVLSGRIDFAHEVLPSSTPAAIDLSNSNSNSSSIFASPKRSPALLGIHRMWTCRAHRRKGLVSAILDCVSRTMIYGRPLTTLQERRAHMAFSQPTESGLAAARSFLKIRQDGEGDRWKVFDELRL